MNHDNKRKAFEEWAYSNKWNICRYPKSDYHMKEGQYCDEFVDGAWHGWIKSANREGYKLVLVEPTDVKLKEFQKIWFDSGCAHIMKKKTAFDLYKAMIGEETK